MDFASIVRKLYPELTATIRIEPGACPGSTPMFTLSDEYEEKFAIKAVIDIKHKMIPLKTHHTGPAT